MPGTIRQSTTSTGTTLYWPGVTAPLGGVVCLHGSEGGNAGWNDLNAALFAANGFAALAHDYTPDARWLHHPDIDNVPLDRTEAALLTMQAEMAPFGCGTGLFGTSRGAEHALLLTQLLAEDKRPTPAAVAVHAPPDATWPAFIVADFLTGQPWTGDSARPAWSWRGGHTRTRPGTPLAITSLPCPLFIAQGTRDTVWGDAMARKVVERLTAMGEPPEAHFFEGENHTFGANARNREWSLLIAFFETHLAPHPT